MFVDDDVEVPISALEHFAYCPRQCGLIHLEQTFEENLYTIRGRHGHERIDSEVDSVEDEVRSVRSIPLWSDRLGIRGKADLVEFRPAGPFPVEFKNGRRHGTYPDVQLCAQALCLEEMLGVSVPRGAIYYFETKRRHPVEIDADLRQRTIAMVEAIKVMLRNQALPEAPNDARCPNCSLLYSCMPSVVGETARLRGLQGALFHAWEVGADNA